MKAKRLFFICTSLAFVLLTSYSSLAHSKESKPGKEEKQNKKEKTSSSLALHSKSKSTVYEKKQTEPKNKDRNPKRTAEIPRTLPVNRTDENETIFKKEDNFSIHLEARRFAQGEVILLRLTPNESKWMEETYKLIWMGKEIPITKQSKSQIAFLPIPPEAKPGSTILEIQSKVLFLEGQSKQYEIELLPTEYTVIKKHEIFLDKKFVTAELSPETLAFIQECVKLKEAAFLKNTGLGFGDHFHLPLESIYVTSPFYIRRDYNTKKGRPHGGVDFRGKVGTPIYAIQDGTVVLAHKMYYEGNFTVIDHGNKIFSLYMHQSELLVKEGDKVRKGQVIGKVGNTGMSTGPHLHLGAKVADVLVNPLSLIALRGIKEKN